MPTISPPDVSQPSFALTGRVGVERGSEARQRVDQRPLLPVVADVGHAPGLVDRHPRDDARMVPVARDDLDPFGRQRRDRVRREPLRARELFPHEHAQLVAERQPAGIFHLLVLADPVEPQVLDHLDVVAQRVDARCGLPGPRPISLVQREAQRHRLAIELEPSAFHADRSDRGVARHLVAVVVTRVAERRVDQLRVFRAPHQLIGVTVCRIAQIESATKHRSTVDDVDERHRVVREQRSVATENDANGVTAAHVTDDLGLEVDRKRRQIRRPAQRRDGRHRDVLEPHRLPDAGRSRIPDLVGLGPPVLLAARDRERSRLVVGPHDELDASGVSQPCDFGDVDRERRVAADVAADQLTVGPHVRFAIHRAEVDEDVSPGRASPDRCRSAGGTSSAGGSRRSRHRSLRFRARTEPG